jgi:methylated-DNA-protein-cysteine methyltransferase-like protein
MSWEPVYRLVKQVPRGRVTTYGALARALKLRGGARAAGYAMAACPRGRGIPWHRMVGAGGKIRLPEPAGALQRRLLEAEGVEGPRSFDGLRALWVEASESEAQDGGHEEAAQAEQLSGSGFRLGRLVRRGGDTGTTCRFHWRWRLE